MVWYDYLNFGFIAINWLLIFINIKVCFAKRRYWVLFFAVYSLTEIISLPFSLYGQNNLFIYNISKPLQCCLLILYFSKVLYLNKRTRHFILLCLIIIVFIFRQTSDIDEYNSFEDILYSGTVIVLCVRFFLELVEAENFVNLKFTEFWFCCSLFVFYGSSFCATGAMNFLIKNQSEIATKLFYVLVVSSLMFYLINAYAIILTHMNPD